MKVSTEIDNNFGYEKITQLVDNIPLSHEYPNQFQQLKTFISTTQAHDYQLQNLCHI